MRIQAQTAAAGRAPACRRPVAQPAGRLGEVSSGLAIAGLAAASALGVRPDLAGADLHAAVGLVAGALAAAAHIRWATGRNLLATLLLAVGMFLGMGVAGGLVSRGAHGAAALVAVLVSMEVHGEHLWQRFRS